MPLEAMHAHASHCSTMFHRWCFMIWIMSCSKSSPYFFLPIILVQVDLNFSHPKNAFPEVVWLFRCFLAKSNLALFPPCGLNHVYLLWWSLLLIVDFDSDKVTPGECFSLGWMLWKGFSLPWTSRSFYVAELTRAFFFLRMYQTVDLATPNVPAISLMDCFVFEA